MRMPPRSVSAKTGRGFPACSTRNVPAFTQNIPAQRPYGTGLRVYWGTTRPYAARRRTTRHLGTYRSRCALTRRSRRTLRTSTSTMRANGSPRRPITLRHSANHSPPRRKVQPARRMTGHGLGTHRARHALGAPCVPGFGKSHCAHWWLLPTLQGCCRAPAPARRRLGPPACGRGRPANPCPAYPFGRPAPAASGMPFRALGRDPRV